MIKTNSTGSFVKTFPSESGNVDETHWVPNTDVWVAESGLVIKVELAGMRREDLELTAEGNRLRIHGQRVDGCRAGKCTFILMEINYGSFESVIDIPPGFDLSKAKAVYQNGFLRIDIPHIDSSTSKKIPIRNGE
ncbi:MAG: Hsp20/alpha crystallin family protein [Verrucomicrobiae bacterium]|nr:Hsp20/alpha crystallin family protein [Verrucomicrobiae bacterium]